MVVLGSSGTYKRWDLVRGSLAIEDIALEENYSAPVLSCLCQSQPRGEQVTLPYSTHCDMATLAQSNGANCSQIETPNDESK